MFIFGILNTTSGDEDSEAVPVKPCKQEANFQSEIADQEANFQSEISDKHVPEASGKSQNKYGSFIT